MPIFKRLLRYALLLTVLGAVLGTAALGIAYWVLAPRLPSVAILKDVEMQVPLRVLSADGKLIATFGETRRIPVTIQQVPAHVKDAFLAAEDADFYHHPGVDIWGTLRAALHVVISGGEKVQGGSTITQQVARNFFLSPEKSYTRKLMEWFLAFRIEHELTKDEILDLYLNKIFLGHRAYGVAAAAEYYYGKTLDQLSIAQCAMLASLPKFPSTGNPVTNRPKAVERRNYVLGRMLEVGFISKAQYEHAVHEPDDAFPHEPPVQVEAPYVAEMARLAAIAQLGNRALTDGYVVRTTIVSGIQNDANNAVRSQLLAYDHRHGWRGPEAHVELPPGSGPQARSRALAALYPVAGLVPGIVSESDSARAHVFMADGQTVDLDLAAVVWARPYINDSRMGPAPKRVDQVLKRGDVVRVALDADGHWQLAQLPKAQAALVTLRPDDGAVEALVGGFSYTQSKFNRATQIARQPGSSFKPFLYSAAFQRGFTPASIVNDAPLVFADPSAKNGEWTPANDDDKFEGPMRLREALAQSKNLVTIRLVDSIGVPYARQYVTRFGFRPDAIPENLSLALGTASVSPMEMARGYAAFANGGFLVNPYFISEIDDRNGKPVYIANPPRACRDCPQRLLADAQAGGARTPTTVASTPTAPALGNGLSQPAPLQGPVPLRLAPRVIGPRNDYLIASLMQSVIRHGTGAAAMALGRSDLSGKTGSTNDFRDGWFSGFNTDIVTTVWVGFDDYGSLGHDEFGARTALPIWMQVMGDALKGQPSAPLPMPPGIITALINRETGLPAAPNDPLAMPEIFRVEDYDRLKAQSPILPKQDKKAYDVF